MSVNPNDETLPPQKLFAGTALERSTPPQGDRASGPAEDDDLLEIGGFSVLEKLGSGGMGVVYKCADIALRRFVAIKVLRRKYSRDENYQRRFRREAQTIASLSHASIAHVYGIGEVETTSGPLLYIVMEHVDGPSLERELASRGRLPPARVLELLRQSAAGLKSASLKGIVHRDIKPSNLLLTAAGELKIVDFGLAKELGTDASITDEGIVLGTPHYISPEQGRGQPVDHRSDMYSLGATAYHLVTGRPPFEGGSQVSVIVSHVSQSPEAPEHLEPAVPPGLSRVLLRLLSKSPEDRYPSYDALLEDLDRLARGQEVPLAPSAARAVGSTRAGRRFRGLLAAGLVLAVGGTALAWTLLEPAPAIDRAHREALGKWLVERPDGGVLLNLDFGSPPPERAGQPSWRSLLMFSQAAPGAQPPDLREGALRWQSFEAPVVLGLRFEVVEEIQVEVGAGSGACDLELSLVDAEAPSRRRLDLRLRPGEETRDPLVATLSGEPVGARDDARPLPVPHLLGQGAFTIYLELQRVDQGVLARLRLDRKKDGARIYESSQVFPGTFWSSGVVSLRSESPVKPFSAAVHRLAVSGRLARPSTLEESTWRS